MTDLSIVMMVVNILLVNKIGEIVQPLYIILPQMSGYIWVDTILWKRRQKHVLHD